MTRCSSSVNGALVILAFALLAKIPPPINEFTVAAAAPLISDLLFISP
jgi:hypothetical protein